MRRPKCHGAPALALAALILLLGALPAQAEPPARDEGVLVTGSPPLTRELVSSLSRLLEWVLDSALTEEQGRELEGMLVETWRDGDREGMRQSLELIALGRRLQSVPEAQRDLLRAQALPALLEAWRQEPQEDAARWALSVYETAHRPIARGTPPLTRQASDAYAEALAFAAREITSRPFEADAAFKDAVAAELVKAYEAYPAATQATLAASPLLWAAVRVAWPTLREDQRAELRQQWAVALSASVPDDGLGREASQALAALDALVEQNRTTPLSAVQRRQAANNLEIVAERLRWRNGPDDRETASRLEGIARGLRASAAQDSRAGSSAGAYEEAMATLGRQHAAFVALQNASLTSHAGTMNMISIMSGSPYRYSVR